MGCVCLPQEDFVRAQESLLWRWQPDHCSLFDFRPIRTQRHSVGALLAKLGPRKIIFVGDSLVLEQYLSLEVRTRDTASAGANKTCCSKDAKVSYPGFDITPGVPRDWPGDFLERGLKRGTPQTIYSPASLCFWHILGRCPEFCWLFWDPPGPVEVPCQTSDSYHCKVIFHITC